MTPISSVHLENDSLCPLYQLKIASEFDVKGKQ